MSVSDEARRAALATVIQEILDRTGLTQSDFSERCGRDSTYINKLMKGRLGFDLADMEDIAKGAGITELELYARFWALRDAKKR